MKKKFKHLTRNSYNVLMKICDYGLIIVVDYRKDSPKRFYVYTKTEDNKLYHKGRKNIRIQSIMALINRDLLVVNDIKTNSYNDRVSYLYKPCLNNLVNYNLEVV